MKLIIIVISIFIISLSGNAQNIQGVYPGRKGIFVNCGSELPKAFKYQISRRDNSQKEWRLVKVLDFPANKTIWNGRIFQEIQNNTEITMPDSASRELLWRILNNSDSSDSLYSWSGYPFMQYACGTGWWDRSVDPAKRYDYKIEKAQDGKITLLNSFAGISSEVKTPEFDLKADSISASGNSVTIDFMMLSYKGMAGSRVYRGNFMRNNFELIHPVIMYTTKRNIRHLSIVDETVVDKAQYSYFIIPFDAYGNDGRSSDTVNIYNSTVNTIPAIITGLYASSQENGRTILLSWKLSSKEDIISIDVYKALVYDGYYTRIASISPDDTTFQDHNVKPVTTYYYTIVLNTAYGRTYPSARIPAVNKTVNENRFPPSNLSAIREGKVVKLKWDRVGEDIRGYYIYRSSGFSGKMQPVSGIVLNSDSLVTYVDSLKNAPDSPVLVYAVASENLSYMISPLSARASVSGKYAFMPVPSNVNVMVNSNNIQLFWDDLSSSYPYVTGYWIYRRVADNQGEVGSPAKRINLKPTAYGVNSFTDTNVVEGLHYYYSLVSIGLDTADVSSPSLETGAALPGQLPLSPGQVRLMNTDIGILLQWTSPLDDNVKNIRILRAKSGESFNVIKTLDPKSEEWLDKDIANDTVYFYQVVSIDKKGRQSLNDEPLGIRSQPAK
jgi:fibronectin type 3 domain-containing protein